MKKPSTEKPIVFTNIKSDKDIVHWYQHAGRFVWKITHKDGLKSYLGSDGSKMQICWENDDPCPYWGW